jgi:hypothetical protein
VNRHPGRGARFQFHGIAAHAAAGPEPTSRANRDPFEHLDDMGAAEAAFVPLQ